MKLIYKYPLNIEGYTTIKAKFAQILDIQMQFDKPVLWAVVDENMEESDITLVSVGTGWPLSSTEEWTYFKTIQEAEGALIWHFFIVENECSCKLTPDGRIYKVPQMVVEDADKSFYSSLEINGEPEYYTDQKTVSEALEYIRYLENKVEELKAEKERILDTAEELTNAWEELKRACRSSLDKTLKTYQKSRR